MSKISRVTYEGSRGPVSVIVAGHVEGVDFGVETIVIKTGARQAEHIDGELVQPAKAQRAKPTRAAKR